MPHPEASFASHEEAVTTAITDILVGHFSNYSKYRTSIDETIAAELVERAQAGEEVEIPLVSGLWTPGQFTSEGDRVRRILDGGWAFSFTEWVWEQGQRVPGYPSEELRDPSTGRLTHPGFISELIQNRKAVELVTREDEHRGLVTVNHEWGLWRSSRVEGFLPFATVNIADADLGEMSRWEQEHSGGPAYLVSPPFQVLVGKKLIILPHLELPQAPDLDPVSTQANAE